MPLISSFAKQAAAPTVEDDVYLATVISADVERDDAGLPKEDAYGKNRLLVKFELDDLTGDDGGPIVVRRSYAISYGAMGGTQAALAIMIGAAMGMPAADKAVRHVTTEELVGKAVRVQTGTVEREGRTYTNVLNVLPPPKARPGQVAPRAATSAKPAQCTFQTQSGEACIYEKSHDGPHSFAEFPEDEVPF